MAFTQQVEELKRQVEEETKVCCITALCNQTMTVRSIMFEHQEDKLIISFLYVARTF